LLDSFRAEDMPSHLVRSKAIPPNLKRGSSSLKVCRQYTLAPLKVIHHLHFRSEPEEPLPQSIVSVVIALLR
jgi:hypothetical protein